MGGSPNYCPPGAISPKCLGRAVRVERRGLQPDRPLGPFGGHRADIGAVVDREGRGVRRMAETRERTKRWVSESQPTLPDRVPPRLRSRGDTRARGPDGRESGAHPGGQGLRNLGSADVEDEVQRPPWVPEMGRQPAFGRQESGVAPAVRLRGPPELDRPRRDGLAVSSGGRTDTRTCRPPGVQRPSRVRGATFESPRPQSRASPAESDDPREGKVWREVPGPSLWTR